jgi:fructuronate reductase
MKPREDANALAIRQGSLLDRDALRRLAAPVRRPAFDPRALRPGILHLGCGAFHRAHQAVLTQHAIEAEMSTPVAPPPAWGIVAASLRTRNTVTALRRQDGLYSVLERGPQSTRVEVVGTLCNLHFAPDEAQALSAQLAEPQIRIVTLTVTEAGYCIDPASGRLDTLHPEVQADLSETWPRSAIGLLVHRLALRRRHGIRPPVVLSCDNMPGNGRLLRQACIDHAALRDDRLAAWIAQHVQFPSSMVDRIVPVTTQRDRDLAAAALGVVDAQPVSAEPFLQWVIERFDGPCPLWEAAGAEFVDDVAPWECSKLRLLNGTHLALACLGSLAGDDTVADTMKDGHFRAFALRLMLEEQKPTLPSSDHDIDAYAHQLVQRWRNSGIAHRLARVGRDASGKLPARWLAPLRENLRHGRPVPCLLLAIAAWMYCVTGRPEAGGALTSSDTRAERMRQLARQAGPDPLRTVDALLSMTDVFGDDLPRHVALRHGLAEALAALQRHGPRGAVASQLSAVAA